jgi:hypothetical protein
MTSDTSAVADAYTAMQTLCAGQYPGSAADRALPSVTTSAPSRRPGVPM